MKRTIIFIFMLIVFCSFVFADSNSYTYQDKYYFADGLNPTHRVGIVPYYSITNKFYLHSSINDSIVTFSTMNYTSQAEGNQNGSQAGMIRYIA